jgi:hypothetical protein
MKMITETITDRVKTFEDAYALVTLSANEIKAQEAAYQLSCIIKALNEDWVIDWNNHKERRYWIYSRYLYNVLFGATTVGAVMGGFSYSSALKAPSFTITNIGDRLCLRNPAHAQYVIDTFPGLLKDYFMVEK